MPALVNPDDCTGCEACVEECPTECIEMKDDVAFVNADECTDCEACVEVCPTECIEMVD